MNNGNPTNTGGTPQFPQYNQQMQQNPFAGPNIVPLKAKKPMKIGWILSLVLVAVSIMVIITGVMVSSDGIKTIKQNAKNYNEAYTATRVDSETYVYKGLTAGKEYAVVLSQQAGPEIMSVRIGSISFSPVFQEKNNLNSNKKSFKVYRFVAQSNSVEVKMSPIRQQTDVEISLLDESKYGSALSQMIMGLIILVVGILMTVLSVIIFIIFLVIFLIKNSNYKRVQRYTSMM